MRTLTEYNVLNIVFFGCLFTVRFVHFIYGLIYLLHIWDYAHDPYWTNIYDGHSDFGPCYCWRTSLCSVVESSEWLP